MPIHPSHHHLLLDYYHSLLIGFPLLSLTPLHSIFHVSIRVIFKIHTAQVSEDTFIYKLISFFNPGKFPAINSANITPPPFPPFLPPRNLNTHIWILSIYSQSFFSLTLTHSSVTSSRRSPPTLQSRASLPVTALIAPQTFHSCHT